jgi:hypothetical protein
MRVLVVLGLLFILLVLVDKLMSSEIINKLYMKHCMKLIKYIPEQQRNKTTKWLKENLTVSTSDETQWSTIKQEMPVSLRYKLTEKKLRAYMHIAGFEVVSDCCLDTDYYAVVIKKNGD